ncbi:MAG: hypothetical protein KME50_29465 [Nostoc desertorum CM1-VF14]|jgi:hypothetical protein|nr:hypothetical protein [Nostoc desertorum CM1-VF14]
MINNFFQKSVVFATGVAIVACLMPNVAQAQRVRFGGKSINGYSVSFDIDHTVPEIEPGLGNQNLGYFPRAIKNFNVVPTNGVDNSTICGQINCPDGNLTITRLEIDSSGNVTNLLIDGSDTPVPLTTLEDLVNNIDNNVENSGSDIDFSKNIFRYDVTFNRNDSILPSRPALVWFVQSNNTNFINNLSRLNRVETIRGIVPASASGGGVFALGGCIKINSNLSISPRGRLCTITSDNGGKMEHSLKFTNAYVSK